MMNLQYLINNPQFIRNMMSQYQDPCAFLERAVGKNPQAQEIINNLRGMTPQERNNYVSNMAKSRNMTMEDVVRKSYPTQVLQMLGMR